MGACFSQTTTADGGLELDRVISHSLYEDRRQNRAKRLLFYGPPNSGKSTLFNQLQAIHGNGFTQEKRHQIKPQIYKYIIQSMQEILQCIQVSLDDTVYECSKVVCNCNANNMDNFAEIENIIHLIDILWQQKEIKHVINHASDYFIDDSVSYFYEQLSQLKDYNRYVPNDKDIIYFKNKNENGINDTTFEIKGDLINVIDIDYNNNIDYKKWIHCFEYITALIFVASLSCYDQIIFDEDDMRLIEKVRHKQFWNELSDYTCTDVSHLIMKFVGISQNAMLKQIDFFHKICNNEWFSNTAVILMLNKKDLFYEKIGNDNGEFLRCFSEYNGVVRGAECVEYITQQFEDRNVTNKIFTHVVDMTDRNLVQNVFCDVQEIIIAYSLEEAGLIDE